MIACTTALGMSDPIFGPSIHNFVDERLDQVNFENSVYFKDLKKGERKGGKYLEKRNMFVEEEKKTEEGKEQQGEKYVERKTYFFCN